MIYIRQDRAMGPNITKRFGEKPATECERISGKKEKNKKYRPWAKIHIWNIHRGQPNRGGMEGSSLIKVIEKKRGRIGKNWIQIQRHKLELHYQQEELLMVKYIVQTFATR